jgi:4-methyl-5(b-hydroxyethyl)-thiazole monophosphate biosynthesis
MGITVVCLAPGFEEIEAIGIIDILRRAGIEVRIAAVDGAQAVQGSHQVRITADLAVTALVGVAIDAVVLPGGMPGSTTLAVSRPVLDLLRQVHQQGGIVAAICAAPLALHAAGLLHGRRYTCFPGIQDRMDPRGWTGAVVERDERIITGKAAGSVFEFALVLVSLLKDGQTAETLRQGMYIPD